MVYEYKWGCRVYPVKASDAGKEFEKIEKRNKEVTAENLLDSARPESSVMHPCFEWNDAVAAEKFRLQEARNIIGSLVKVVVDKGRKQPMERTAYVNINPDRGFGSKGRYIPIEKAMSDRETRGIVLGRALAELVAFQRKYRELVELGEVFDAIQKAANALAGTGGE